MKKRVDVILNRILGIIAYGVLMVLIYQSAFADGGISLGMAISLMGFILILLGLTDVVLKIAEKYSSLSDIAVAVEDGSVAVEEPESKRGKGWDAEADDGEGGNDPE